MTQKGGRSRRWETWYLRQVTFPVLAPDDDLKSGTVQVDVEIVEGIAPGVRFYFFSDEPQWVMDELIPKIGDIDYVIVSDDDESDKGYMDMFLISKSV